MVILVILVQMEAMLHTVIMQVLGLVAQMEMEAVEVLMGVMLVDFMVMAAEPIIILEKTGLDLEVVVLVVTQIMVVLVAMVVVLVAMVVLVVATVAMEVETTITMEKEGEVFKMVGSDRIGRCSTGRIDDE